MERQDILDKLDTYPGITYEDDLLNEIDDDCLFEFAKEDMKEYYSEEYYEEEKEKLILTKYQVLLEIENAYKKLEKHELDVFSEYNDVITKMLVKELKSFYNLVLHSPLPEPLPKYWEYKIVCTCKDISLQLVYESVSADVDDNLELDGYSISSDKYNLINYDLPCVTSTVYAKKHGVEPVTVRQWIRRGKLIEAYKRGKEWYIPILANPSDKYFPRGYSWKEKFTDLPKEYEILNKYSDAYFSQSKENKNQFIVTLSDYLICDKKNKMLTDLSKWKDYKEKNIAISREEREKLELYLMQSSNVEGDEKILFEIEEIDNIVGYTYIY